ncbi:MAG TPA: aldo/keto reductase [Xanthobacteraceae bacterium]|jgi:aryl-alcohol dehydrogenase-like predicted oxidoreductase
MRLTRREFAKLPAEGAAAAAAMAMLLPAAFAQSAAPLITRVIPSSGERLPAVGLGTAEVFDTDDPATRQKAAAVIQALLANDGTLIDTASTYGDAESILGAVTAMAGLRAKLFVATKLEAPDDRELHRSLARLRTDKLDLLQLHNVDDPQQSLSRFREWKAQGICRYIGITSTFHGAFPALEAVLTREKPDFVQVDYSLDDPEAEKRILPRAAEVKAAVLTALPFGHGRLFRAVRGKAIPDWASAFAGSWAQFFIKFLLGDPRVTAVIPGTANPAHMTDNLSAMRGALPNPDQRQRMVEFLASL